MSKGLTTVLLSALIFLLPCLSGCESTLHFDHTPPPMITCDKPWVIQADIRITPPEFYGGEIDNCNNIILHFRDASVPAFIDIPMNVVDVDRGHGRLSLRADMPPISCRSGIKYVEYYIDYLCPFNGRKYHKTQYYRVHINP